MGLMTDGEMSFTESSIPAIVFSAFKSIADVAPRRDEVLPVTICRREAMPPLPER